MMNNKGNSMFTKRTNRSNKIHRNRTEWIAHHLVMKMKICTHVEFIRPRILTLRYTGMIAAICCLLLCMACGMSTDPAGSPPRIALITPAGTGELAEAIRLGAEAAAKEAGAELITVEAFPSEGLTYAPSIPDFTAGQGKVKQEHLQDGTYPLSEREQAQVDAVSLALEQGASALLIDPLSEKALSDIIQKAQTQNANGVVIPVILLNDEFPVKGITSVISMDNVEAGRQAGQAMAVLLGGRGRIALLGPDPVNPVLINRELGVEESLAQYPDIHVEAQSVCSTRDACWQVAKQLLDQQQVDGLIALQESASLGAADELNRRTSENNGNKVKIVGFGSEQQQLEQLQEGRIQHLIVQNGFSAGYLGVNQAVARLNNQQVQARVTLETKLVSTDNMFWMDNQKLLFPFVQ
ncbi:substrate-binding domain-containing protein [Paenibacillus sp. OK076]|uniref:substrate-binding domain-containing protein n=1 Tax=Paenibacillus sp. OK076 TaxID=1884379 RepID=UPI0008D880F1|nr:substrate-binding domain-containing protein [Paenibacillus sp. OK076]SEM79226.1 monosaccharide ABC transporter substrate-binding protein, CUT2 family [Paenibacillus sp. OK076]